jgi:GNAT superfamily N-acetyltransferase
MKPVLEPRHDLSPMEIDAVEDRLYEHNSSATGRHDGQGLGFVIRDAGEKPIAVANGCTWAGVSEIRQMWVDKAFRGRGYGRALVEAMVAGGATPGRTTSMGRELRLLGAGQRHPLPGPILRLKTLKLEGHLREASGAAAIDEEPADSELW